MFGRMQQELTVTKKDSITKKDIIRQISESIDETQLKTKEIVQRTFEAIVETLINKGRIELRNFGVFEVKRRKARKARNPRTGDAVNVPEKNVVTFKPGKRMEELVSQMTTIPDLIDDDEDAVTVDIGTGSNGKDDHAAPKAKPGRARKSR
jgi:integration host factor subunit beta